MVALVFAVYREWGGSSFAEMRCDGEAIGTDF